MNPEDATRELLEMFENCRLQDKQAELVLTTFPGMEPLHAALLEKVKIQTIGYAGTVIRLNHFFSDVGTKAMAAAALATYLDDGLHWLLLTQITPDFASAKKRLLALEAKITESLRKTEGGPFFGGGRSAFRQP